MNDKNKNKNNKNCLPHKPLLETSALGPVPGDGVLPDLIVQSNWSVCSCIKPHRPSSKLHANEELVPWGLVGAKGKKGNFLTKCRGIETMKYKHPVIIDVYLAIWGIETWIRDFKELDPRFHKSLKHISGICILDSIFWVFNHWTCKAGFKS